MYKNIFIDIDDTLWDFKTNSKKALAVTYCQYDIKEYYPDFEEFYRIYSEKNMELWKLYHIGRIDKPTLMTERFNHLFYRLGLDKPDLSQEMDHTYLTSLATQKSLVPYALELLQYLRGKYKIYTISNGFKEVQYKKMESAGIHTFFDRVVLSDEIGITKPDPRIFEYAMQVTHSACADSLMIGDNYDADIMGAAHFGLHQIYFNPAGLPVTELTPTYTVSSLQDIIAIL